MNPKLTSAWAEQIVEIILCQLGRVTWPLVTVSPEKAQGELSRFPITGGVPVCALSWSAERVDMSSRWRITLALAGLAIIVASTLVLLYVIWPVEPMIERFQPPPTLFVAPGSITGW